MCLIFDYIKTKYVHGIITQRIQPMTKNIENRKNLIWEGGI